MPGCFPKWKRKDEDKTRNFTRVTGGPNELQKMHEKGDLRQHLQDCDSYQNSLGDN